MTTIEGDLGRCRSCRAPVRWVRTIHGKAHPLDARPTPEGEWVIRPAVGNKAIMIEWSPLQSADEPRYTSHFATCPNSRAWSGRARNPKASPTQKGLFDE